MSEEPAPARRGYKYKEHATLTCGTTDGHVDLKRLPDRIHITNSDATNTAFVKFDEASNITDGYPIGATREVIFDVQAKSIHGICSAGTPKLYILALAYKEERVKA
jgi:hypothetical protein